MAMGGGRGRYSPCYGGISVMPGVTVRAHLSLRLAQGWARGGLGPARGARSDGTAADIPLPPDTREQR